MFLTIRFVFISVIFYIFHLNVEEELNQQVCLIKHAVNEISNSTSHTKKREEQKDNLTSKILFPLKLLKNCH